jgi:hypothetical protein
MTSSPERTTKKTPVASIVGLLSNGCKQAFPLLTVDLQRTRHNTMKNIQAAGVAWGTGCSNIWCTLLINPKAINPIHICNDNVNVKCIHVAYSTLRTTATAMHATE